MKVLVTGATGFVGRELVKKLAREGHEVFATVRRGAGDLPAGVRDIVVDLASLDVNSLPQGLDAIIALAQSRNYQDFPECASDVFLVNTDANMKLMDWARRRGVGRFVLASSGGIYARCARLILAESDQLQAKGIDYYLSTKLAAEMMLQSFASCFQAAIILRPFFIYGRGQPSHMLMPRLISSVRSGKAVRLEGQDGSLLNPVHVDDAASAFASALSVDGGHIFNVAGPDVLSIRRICEVIGRKVDRKPLFDIAGGTPEDLTGTIDLAIARLHLPRTSFEVGLARTLEV